MPNVLIPSVLVLSLASAVHSAAPMRVGMNVWFDSYWTGDLPFTDCMKSARHFKYTAVNDPGSQNDPYPFESSMQASAGFYQSLAVDSNGYPLQVPVMHNGTAYRPVTVMLNACKKSVYPVGTFTLVFEGSGRIVLGWDARDTIDATGGTTNHSFTVTRAALDAAPSTPASPYTRGIVLTIVRSEAADHIRNVRVILPGYADSWGHQPFTREWLAGLRPFNVVRFMDWCNANHSKVVRWGDRVTPNDFPQGVAAEDMRYDSSGGVAYEHMIDVCNLVNRDLWLCVPVWADTAYYRELARLVRTRLSPSLKLYLEWGNETWNGMFEGATRCQRAWDQQKLTDQWGTFLNWESYHAYFAAAMFHVFDEEFSGQSQRLVKVLAGQTGNFSGVMEKAMRAFKNPVYNPHNVRADALATTAYFSTWTAGSPPHFYSTADLQKHRDLADSEGLDYLAYEGGEDYLGWAQKQYHHDIYRQAFSTIQTYFTMFTQYCYVAMSWSMSSEPWGAKQYAAQPSSDAPKYRFLVDYLDSTNQWDLTEAFDPYGTSSITAQPVPRDLHSQLVVTHSSEPHRIHDLAGRLLFRAAGPTTAVRHIAPGVYVVKGIQNARLVTKCGTGLWARCITELPRTKFDTEGDE